MFHPDSGEYSTVSRWENGRPAGYTWSCGCTWYLNGEEHVCAAHVAARQQATSRFPRPAKPGVNAACSKRACSGGSYLRHDELAHRCIEVPGHPGWCVRYTGGGPIGVDASAYAAFYAPVEPGKERLYEDRPIELPDEVRDAFYDSGFPESVSTYFG